MYFHLKREEVHQLGQCALDLEVWEPQTDAQMVLSRSQHADIQIANCRDISRSLFFVMSSGHKPHTSVAPPVDVPTTSDSFDSCVDRQHATTRKKRSKFVCK